jgi:hypothetical protein
MVPLSRLPRSPPRRLMPSLAPAAGKPQLSCTGHLLDGALAALLGQAGHYLEKPLRVGTAIATATAPIGKGRADLHGQSGPR